MLTKLTRANQITIPKPIAQRLGLRAGVDYLNVEYVHGVIVLKAVEVEERIPPETYEKFQRATLTAGAGDVAAEPKEAKHFLADRAKRR